MIASTMGLVTRVSKLLNGPGSAHARLRRPLQTEAVEDRAVPAFFTTPYDGTLYLQSLGGDAAPSQTEFGLVSSQVTDDFSAGSLDPSLWQVSGAGNATVEDGRLDITLQPWLTGDVFGS